MVGEKRSPAFANTSRSCCLNGLNQLGRDGCARYRARVFLPAKAGACERPANRGGTAEFIRPLLFLAEGFIYF